MPTSQELITESVQSTADRLNDIDTAEVDVIEEVEPLDVYAEVHLNGNVTSVTLVLGTGGPHIELDLRGHVEGYWGGAHALVSVTNDALLDTLKDYYWDRFEELVAA